MTEHLDIRLRSERGASFSFALLVMLVCVAVSAVVITAASASAGQFAKLGEMDQRYYSVTSAAGLFRDALGDDGELTLTYVCSRTGTKQARGSSSANVSWENNNTAKLTDVSAKVSGTEVASTSGVISLLSGITSNALFGHAVSLSDTLSGAANPFETNWSTFSSTPDGKTYYDLVYTLIPSNVGSTTSSTDLEVKIRGRLWNDWTLELEFSNADAKANDTNKFPVYMVFAATYTSDLSTSEDLGDTTVENAAANEITVTNQITFTQTKTSTVVWRLQRMITGRGLADVDD